MSFSIKTPEEVKIIREACKIQSEILNRVCEKVEDGISTLELDTFAEKLCKEKNVKPAFKGYQGFPSSICASKNSEVVHGVPSNEKILKNGDIISIDFGVILEGWYADACKTVGVGEVSEDAKQLMEKTYEALYEGIAQARSGNHVGDIGNAIEGFVNQFGYKPVVETVGHGIGRSLHEEPEIPNWGSAGEGMELREGMVVCIEPIINMGVAEINTSEDGWSTQTKDGKLSAHFEHQVLITKGEAEILTNWDKL